MAVRDSGVPLTAKRRSSEGQTAAAEIRACDEVAHTLHAEITRCATHAAEQAMLLESIAAHSFTLTGEIFPDSRAPDLLQLSHRIRGIVLQGLGVLAELQCIAGRLDALASLRAADPSLEPRDI